MVFSSHIFVFWFLPIVIGAYYLTPRRGRHLLLTVFSYFFYGWANPYFMFLMFFSTVVDYICGLSIAGRFGSRWNIDPASLEKGGPRNRAQKAALIISIVTNLSLLGFFKYFNFGLDSYNALVSALGMDALAWNNFLRITLPLGISFYTFQSMSYTIDVYRGEARAIRNFADFMCYVSMFPQLVAGPIVRFHEIADQLISRQHTLAKFARGVAFFCLGMAKKIIIANPCGKVADLCFDSASRTIFDAWYGAVCYSFQIYFDFSGYSDMAIGLGLMLGFMFPKNFDRPYISQSITEFWNRWHLSLSRWLRDYLYIPLGGNRKGIRRTFVNLGIVMLLGGLWHGAAWNFVVWGAFHGILLGLERLRGRNGLLNSRFRAVNIAFTFFLVLISWVFFRASNISEAFRYLGTMFGLADVPANAGLLSGLVLQPFYITVFIIAALVVWMWRDTWKFTENITAGKVALILILFVVSLIMMNVQAYNPFIYFIF